jgi:hypothetical protein
MTLEQVRAKAQQTANRENRVVAILNLNPLGAQYVIRDATSGIENARGFVETVGPDPLYSFVAQIARMTLPGETDDGWPSDDDSAETVLRLVLRARELTT